jgi:SAM-dependent methyltransferase
MPGLKRIYNILRYGLGDGARVRKNAAKEKAREEKFASGLWQQEQGIAKRHYGSYEEYVTHQAGKLDRIVHRLKETEREDLAEFTRRFGLCEELAGPNSVLCLGARLGTEVRAMVDLGHFAVGIDLNPGENNPLVLPGDFHHLAFADASVDAVYTNVMDHVFDLEKVVSEIVRVLKPGGIFIAELLPGFDEGFVPGEYESSHWQSVDEFSRRIAETGGFDIETKRDMGQHRRDHWYQFVFRKAA